VLEEMNMDAPSSVITNLLVSHTERSKAQIKYELKKLENALEHLIITTKGNALCIVEVQNLCRLIFACYLDYLSLLGINLPSGFYAEVECAPMVHWSQYYSLVSKLKKKSAHNLELEVEKNVLIDISSLYYRIIQSNSAIKKHDDSPQTAQENQTEMLYQLFVCGDLKLWLLGLINFSSQYSPEQFEAAFFFQDWDLQQQQYTLDFFAAPECIQLINALFYYKLYPEKLYDEVVHPEKLVSIRFKLGLLHQNIEILQQQLYRTALQHGLKPEIDCLVHNDDLPEGVMLEINELCIGLIKDAVQLLNTCNPLKHQVLVPKMSHLLSAYKYSFNPIRLIDTAMHIRHLIEKNQQGASLTLYDGIIGLYRDLTTSQCLDLYGYFANNDTRYLLNALHLVINESPSLTWLPSLTKRELNAVELVNETIHQLMDALRAELKNRLINTERYKDKLEKKMSNIRTRNRQAVLRVIDSYGLRTKSVNSTLEQLFIEVEESIKGEGY
jgi:hypothetical protein